MPEASNIYQTFTRKTEGFCAATRRGLFWEAFQPTCAVLFLLGTVLGPAGAQPRPDHGLFLLRILLVTFGLLLLGLFYGNLFSPYAYSHRLSWSACLFCKALMALSQQSANFSIEAVII